MYARKLERLLNLTMCLMSTQRFLTVDEVGRLVDGYTPADPVAFRRMFERDKEDLRDLGIPLQTDDHTDSGEIGYRIRRSDYALPEVRLDAEEAAAVSLVARTWWSAAFADASSSALRKLSAGGAQLESPPPSFEPRLDTDEPHLAACWQAARDGRAVTFAYRGVQAPQAGQRRVEPWGVVAWRGRWYLVGHDRDRAAARAFRLSRIQGAVRLVGPPGAVSVPPGVDLLEQVRSVERREQPVAAVVRVRAGHGHGLRRQAVRIEPAHPGWERLHLTVPDPVRFADTVAELGPDAVAESPEALRDAVVARLRELAG